MAAKYANASAEDILKSLPNLKFGTVRVKDKPHQVNDSWVLDVELTWLVTTATGEQKNARISWPNWNQEIPTAEDLRERFNGRQGMVLVFEPYNKPYKSKTTGEMVDQVVCIGMNFSCFNNEPMDAIMRKAAELADAAGTKPLVQPVATTVPVAEVPLQGNRYNSELAGLAAQRPVAQVAAPPVARPTVPQRPSVPRPQVPR